MPRPRPPGGDVVNRELHIVKDTEVIAAFLESARTPVDRIRAAIAWLGHHHPQLRILTGEYGVIPGMFAWQPDTRRRPGGVSPLGAVVLAYQPPVGGDLPDPAAKVLGVAIQYAEGFADGFDNEPSGHFLRPEYPISRRSYCQGLEAGYALRFELTQQCPSCGSRHFNADPCPLCEEREGDCS
jgi:hypothetical protein